MGARLCAQKKTRVVTEHMDLSSSYSNNMACIEWLKQQAGVSHHSGNSKAKVKVLGVGVVRVPVLGYKQVSSCSVFDWLKGN